MITMYVLVTYDVETVTRSGASRLRKVAKICVNHGKRVQNSVFECLLTEAQFTYMKNQIDGVIDKDSDSVRFYFLGKNWDRKIETLGKSNDINLDGELII